MPSNHNENGLQNHSIGETYPFTVVILDRGDRGKIQAYNAITGENVGLPHNYRWPRGPRFHHEFETAHRAAERDCRDALLAANHRSWMESITAARDAALESLADDYAAAESPESVAAVNAARDAAIERLNAAAGSYPFVTANERAATQRATAADVALLASIFGSVAAVVEHYGEQGEQREQATAADVALLADLFSDSELPQPAASQRLVEYRFLIPILTVPGDRSSVHSRDAWADFNAKLVDNFGGYTAGLIVNGAWRDESGVVIEDQSIPYTVAIPDHVDAANSLRNILQQACRVFNQQCIYLASGGNAELVYARD